MSSAQFLQQQDALRSVRAAFYLGLWNRALKDIESLRKDGDASLGPALDVFYYRILQRLRPEMVAKEIKKDSSAALQAVKIFTGFNQLRLREQAAGAKNEAARAGLFGTLDQWLSYEGVQDDPTLKLMAAQVYLLEGSPSQALPLVRESLDNIEHLALSVQIYLQLNRPELASQAVARMQELDDDDALAQLCQAQLQISLLDSPQQQLQGKPVDIAETVYLLQDLSEKFGPSVPVLNTLAAIQIRRNDCAGAFKLLREARELAIRYENKPDPVTLVNSIVCLRRLRKEPAIVDKIVAQLRQLDPQNAWLQSEEDQAAAEFDAAAASFRS